MDVRESKIRVTKSPDRAKIYRQNKAIVKPMTRKVQVVYYLTRNGQLEHPHFMEVTHLANQPLTLSDVMKRLADLRGMGMPSLYSWSCKRSYKNGYVWSDLAEKDTIYPSDGAEFVLKGSEIVQCSSEKFLELQVRKNRASSYIQEQSNSHLLCSKPKPESEPDKTTSLNEEEEEEELCEIEEEKTSYTSSTTPRSRCSRGVSTDELEFPDERKTANTINNQPKTTPSDTNESTLPQRFEDGDPVVSESGSSRGSVLLQLISCGNIATAKTKNMVNPKKSSGGNLHRGVLSKNLISNAVVVGVEEEEDDDDKEMIRFMSENPRFGNLQAEEKEYFSGSIVESVSRQERVANEPFLKKSNSYKERNKKVGIEEDKDEEKMGEKSRMGKCIPINTTSCMK